MNVPALNKENIKKLLKAKCSNILIKYEVINEDYGFFSEYNEVYHDKKGIKICSTLENISYSLKEFDYFLLENTKIAKFIRHDSLESSYRELYEEFTITNYKRKFKGRKPLLDLISLERELSQN